MHIFSDFSFSISLIIPYRLGKYALKSIYASFSVNLLPLFSLSIEKSICSISSSSSSSSSTLPVISILYYIRCSASSFSGILLFDDAISADELFWEFFSSSSSGFLFTLFFFRFDSYIGLSMPCFVDFLVMV